MVAHKGCVSWAHPGGAIGTVWDQVPAMDTGKPWAPLDQVDTGGGTPGWRPTNYIGIGLGMYAEPNLT